ncbi:PLP-dependent transferase [Paxillus ammoniavirescens]|nr:PLP-dependent transferase [Paxillus ammoniavirescens]
MTTTIALGDIPWGQPLPPTPHALCLSLPNWEHVVGYQEREKIFVDAVVTGYPRFFIHRSVQKLIDICEQKFGHDGETCLIFPSRRGVEHCRDFILRQAALANISAEVRTVQYPMHPGDSSSLGSNVPMAETCACLSEFHLAFFPNEVYAIARKFWQHCGLGISSRRAEHYLSLIETTQSQLPSPERNYRLTRMYEDTYFDADAIVMEDNSRGFLRRMRIMNDNAESICDFLHPRSIAGGSPPESTVIKQVLYPKYTSPTNYSRCQLPNGRYGGLFSLTFVSLEASKAFYDALSCAKGPSFGYEFTLTCPYTIVAHYDELGWAAEYGVDEGLVRICAGVEDTGVLLRWIEVALKAAEACVGVRSCSLGM